MFNGNAECDCKACSPLPVVHYLISRQNCFVREDSRLQHQQMVSMFVLNTGRSSHQATEQSKNRKIKHAVDGEFDT